MCVCVCSCSCLQVWISPPIQKKSLYPSRLFSPSFSPHTHTNTQPILIWFFPKAWSQWSIVWVLFSTVTGGWDNGAQLNCAQLIYFYLRKQIGCTVRDRGLSLKTPQKGPQRRQPGKKPHFTKLCQLQPQLLGSFPFTLRHLDNTIFSLKRCCTSYVT